MAATMSPATHNKNVIEPNGRLAGKVAVVTGATRGIGYAIAKAFVREGAKIVVVSRTNEEIKSRVAEFAAMGADAAGALCDVSDPGQAQRLYLAATRTFGRIDVLVNNASMLGPRKAIVDYPYEQWKQVLNANLDSAFNVIKGALGTMIPQNAGSIINVSSGVGHKGRGKWGAYAVSKGALETLTEVLADELQPCGIRVNTVNPGPVRTAMRAEAFPKEDPATLVDPDDIVNAFIYLASDASKGVSGMHLESKDWMGRTF